MNSDKLNIAYIVGWFPMVSETFIVNQIASLLDEGHHVTIFSYYPGNLKTLHPKVVEYDLISRTHVFKGKHKSFFGRFSFLIGFIVKNLFKLNLKVLFSSLNVFRFGKKALNLSIFYEAQWFVNKNDFDVIHVHFGVNAKRIAYLKYLGILKSIPLITSFHGYGLPPNQEVRNQKIYRHIFTYSNAITVNTQFLKEALARMEVTENKIEILPVGLDTDYFRYKGTNRDGKKILFCGRLIPLKAPDLAIEIIHRLIKKGHEGLELVILGTGELEEQLKKQVNDLKLQENVIFMGAQPQDIIKEQMETASLFLFPGIKDPNTGRAEAQGLVIQEAQSMEIPTVVSSAGGMKYGLLPNESGFVVDEGDIDGFVEKIEMLLKDDALRQKMGQKGRTFVTEKYENRKLVKRLLEIYHNSLN